MSDSGQPPEAEVVTGEPVPATAVEPARSGGTVEVSNRQVATLAATGFAAGVVTAAVIGRRGGPLKRRRRRKGPLGEVLSSNSFLVDVHVLKR